MRTLNLRAMLGSIINGNKIAGVFFLAAAIFMTLGFQTLLSGSEMPEIVTMKLIDKDNLFLTFIVAMLTMYKVANVTICLMVVLSIGMVDHRLKKTSTAAPLLAVVSAIVVINFACWDIYPEPMDFNEIWGQVLVGVAAGAAYGMSFLLFNRDKM